MEARQVPVLQVERRLALAPPLPPCGVITDRHIPPPALAVHHGHLRVREEGGQRAHGRLACRSDPLCCGSPAVGRSSEHDRQVRRHEPLTELVRCERGDRDAWDHRRGAAWRGTQRLRVYVPPRVCARCGRS
eukprot:scaffold530_cov54-Phaeocystis_antarctica.AAC.1